MLKLCLGVFHPPGLGRCRIRFPFVFLLNNIDWNQVRVLSKQRALFMKVVVNNCEFLCNKDSIKGFHGGTDHKEKKLDASITLDFSWN